MTSCNCNNIIVNNSQAVTLFSVVRVNSRQLARELCQCSRSTTKCITTTKLFTRQILSSTTSATCRCLLAPGPCCLSYLYLEESLANNGCGACHLAVFIRKSISSKTPTGPIEGVITFFKNELDFLSQIAYSAKTYLHISILQAVLLNHKNENNSNWTRFI